MATRTVRHRINGFSLVESIIATVLLVIGIISLMRVCAVGISSEAEIEERAIALSLANEKMEDIKNTTFGSISIGTSTETGSDLGFDFITSRVTDVSNYEGESDLKDIKITVSWETKGGTDSVELQTLIANFE